MRKKVNCLFFTMENSHRDFCTLLENHNFDFVVKKEFSHSNKSEDFSDIKVIFVDFSFLCAFDFSILMQIRKSFFSVGIYVVSEEESSCFVVQSIKYGADDYFLLPCNPNLIVEKIKTKVFSSISDSNEDLIPEFIGKNEKIIALKNQVIKYASSNLPILIIGETGTGKSFLAKIIHKYSHLSKNPYFEENMATVPETIAETLLFGAKKGIYTGAENHKGLVEAANTGTLFLDEITEASLGIQAKLLRVISEKLYRPLGATEDKTANLRLITATNADLQKLIKEKTFREDLFYRINPLTIKIPPLRERKDDIPLLIDYFVNKNKKDITFGAINMLIEHNWKGNVRELESTLQRAICLCSNNTITKEDLIFY